MKLTIEEKQKVMDVIDTVKERHPEIKILWVCVEGSRVYGTATPTSDIDLRGYYINPAKSFLGFTQGPETIDGSKGDIEWSFQELGKFLSLLLSPNMNFIEQLLNGETIICEDEELHNEIVKIASKMLSKDLWAHIQGMTIHTKKHAQKEGYANPKRNLYLYREVLRGLILLRDSKFVSNIFEQGEIYGNESVNNHLKQLYELKISGEKIINPSLIYDIKEELTQLEKELMVHKEFGTLPARKDDGMRRVAEKLLINKRLEEFEE